MTTTVRNNRRVVLAKRPEGDVTADAFRIEEVPVDAPSEGRFLVRNRYLSLDPYMRGRMDDVRSYAKPNELNEVMGGGAVGEVIESRHPGFSADDKVLGAFGWQLYATSDGTGVNKLASSRIPITAWLGVVGMPGVTAWYGLNRILVPKPGQTLCVSAASGAVGSVVGQLAKAAGCRVVGIAGGERKRRLVIEEYGFDACVDYKTGALVEELEAATPDGIDLYFENVGGAVMNAVLGRMNAFGRVAVCGLIAGYNGGDISLQRVRSILVNRLLVQGFIVSDHLDLWPQALKELEERVAGGSLRYRETIVEGLDNAPAAFIGLLAGGNIGKQLIKLD